MSFPNSAVHKDRNIVTIESANQNFLCLYFQSEIDAAVKQLLALKEDYKNLLGKEYKPGAGPAASASDPLALYEKVAAQGDKVRSLKSNKAAKVRLIESGIQC